MNYVEKVQAVTRYEKDGSPVPSQVYVFGIRTPLPVDPQELLGHAANGLRTVLSPDRGGPLWQMTHHVIPYPGFEGVWYFKANAHYIYNKASAPLGIPTRYAYLHVLCVGEWAENSSLLRLFFKDDLGWIFEPHHLMTATVRSVTYFFKAQNLAASIIANEWIDFPNFP